MLTGMVPYDADRHERPASERLQQAAEFGWAAVIIAIAGVAGITSVLLVMMLSAPRVFLAMARDGLLPQELLWRRAPEISDALEEHHPRRRVRRNTGGLHAASMRCCT